MVEFTPEYEKMVLHHYWLISKREVNVWIPTVHPKYDYIHRSLPIFVSRVSKKMNRWEQETDLQFFGGGWTISARLSSGWSGVKFISGEIETLDENTLEDDLTLLALTS